MESTLGALANRGGKKWRLAAALWTFAHVQAVRPRSSNVKLDAKSRPWAPRISRTWGQYSELLLGLVERVTLLNGPKEARHVVHEPNINDAMGMSIWVKASGSKGIRRGYLERPDPLRRTRSSG